MDRFLGVGNRGQVHGLVGFQDQFQVLDQQRFTAGWQSQAEGRHVLGQQRLKVLRIHGFLWVKGRDQALRIYDLLALSGQLAETQKTPIADYAKGLAHWRAGEFDQAERCFGRSAEADRPAAIFRERARELCARPPGAEWEPIRTLQEK